MDEPVGRVDPEGLEGEAAVASGGFFSGFGDWFGDMAKKIGGIFSPDEAQAATGNQAAMAGQTAANSTDTSQAPGASSQSNATATKDQAKYAIFDRKQGTLEVHDGQGANTWNATSGPYGNGALPPGNYTIGGNIPKTIKDAPFCDKDGNCFSIVLTPKFPTDRTELRIHPDGGDPGTAGCIGVKDGNTDPLFNSLKGMRGRQVEVR